MKIVRCQGGLGNQMFQFAFYLSLKYTYKEERVLLDHTSNYATDRNHNGFELDRVFPHSVYESASLKESLALADVGYDKITKLRHRFFGRKLKSSHVVQDHPYRFIPQYYAEHGLDRYYEGFWQNEQYFKNIDSAVRAAFRFPDFQETQNIEIADLLQSDQQTVSLHVRRGDLLTVQGVAACSEAYYIAAVDLIKQKLNAPVFFIFSDDIEWCKQTLQIAGAKFIHWNTGKQSFRDMQLMSLCKHHIIANSSFSWWGAWLNPDRNKTVIAPTPFYSNWGDEIIPGKWIKVRNP